MSGNGAQDPEQRLRSGLSRLDIVLLIALTLLGGAVRFISLADPGELVFDETYYAKDACMYVAGDIETCKLEAAQAEVHPPLGKWLIAGGIRFFGFDPFGWRVAVALAGTITIALLYLLALRLFSSTLGAALSAFLLATDFLHVVQSRTSMLDIFLPMFGVAALLFVVLDRDRPEGAGREWRLAAGIAAGAATATKWSGAPYLVAAFVLIVASEVSRRRRDQQDDAYRSVLKEEGTSILVCLVVVPLLVYLVTYIARVDGSVFALPWAEGSWLRNIWDSQHSMLQFHRELSSTHSYQSPPWSWLLLKRPVSYYFDTANNGDYKEVLALGNPIVWWSSILALAYTAFRLVRTRDLRGPEGFIIIGFALTYGPWLLPFVSRSVVFLFYLLPAVPFMCLALGYVGTQIGDMWEARAAQALFVAATLGLFAFYYPLLTKRALPKDSWNARLLIFEGEKACAKPTDGPVTTETVTETVSGELSTQIKRTQKTDDLPPVGWCWI